MGVVGIVVFDYMVLQVECNVRLVGLGIKQFKVIVCCSIVVVVGVDCQGNCFGFG